MTDSPDDICGAETNDGGKCQNPPSRDDDLCHLHTQVEEQVQVGRHFKITESDHDAILEAARMGASEAGCARAAGVRKQSLTRYLNAHDEFRKAFARARSRGEQRLLTGPLEKDPNDEVEMDGSHARFILSTSFGYTKTEKRELEDVTEGEGGFGTTVVLDSEYVDE